MVGGKVGCAGSVEAGAARSVNLTSFACGLAAAAASCTVSWLTVSQTEGRARLTLRLNLTASKARIAKPPMPALRTAPNHPHAVADIFGHSGYGTGWLSGYIVDTFKEDRGYGGLCGCCGDSGWGG
jgi:hypothetical protein